ncbi:hypothetical protein KJ641_03680, partial [Patescibacteria group bacterium]|nr:hypothetical protein [Patescibacteria group bacterium]
QVGVFDGQRSNYYLWEFETDTGFDFDPPQVRSISPVLDEVIPRNQIVQINFSEPMAYISATGLVDGSEDSFTNIIFTSSAVHGNWTISNGYKTVEFVPLTQCGVNSCGEDMFCLEIDCSPTDYDCQVPMSTLIRTPDLAEPGSWQARPPWNGVVDMAGNALDGSGDGIAQGRPVVTTGATDIAIGEGVADNYLWLYRIKNEIDRTAPYINNIAPGVDAEGIDKDSPFYIIFSKPMLTNSLVGIDLIEHPFQSDIDEPWITRRSELVEFDGSSKTKVNLNHREFGPNGLDLFYFTSVSSSVRSLTQNCLYPGQGPEAVKDANSCTYIVDDDGSVSSSGCIDAVTAGDNTDDTGCAQTNDISDDSVARPDVADCINYMKGISTRQN